MRRRGFLAALLAAPTEFSRDGVRVYDAGGVLRMHWGVLS